MTLTQFLIWWAHFVTTHACSVYTAANTSSGYHDVYDGSCAQAFPLAGWWQGLVTWSGASSGMLNLAGGFW